MTEEDTQEIAAIFLDVLESHGPCCPHGIDADAAATLKSFARAVKSGRKTAYKAFVTLVIGALCAALYAGARELFNQ